MLAVVAAAVALAVAGPSTPSHPASDSAAHSSATGSRAHAHPGAAHPGTGHGGTAAAGHAPVARGPRGTEAVPILMYHVINPAPAGAPFPGLYVPPAEFAEQMRALADAGYHAVTLDQVWASWTAGAPLPAGRPVVVTFDNGYLSQYTNALPVLRQLGWEGVENLQLTGLPPSQGGLSTAQVAGLVAAGWELDTQGYSHADLPTLDAAELHHQVADARAALQRTYHVPVNWFCYPSGHYDAAVVAAVQAAGYRGSTTVIPGWASPGGDPYRLPRLRVLAGTTGAQLLAEIAGIRDEPPPPPSYGT